MNRTPLLPVATSLPLGDTAKGQALGDMPNRNGVHGFISNSRSTRL